MLSSINQFLTTNSNPTSAELALINACQQGKSCIFGPRPDTQTNSTCIRADLLRLLIIGGSPQCGLMGTGVHLEGAWITGELDLSFMTALGQTTLEACHFTNTPNFIYANLRHLSLSRSHLPGLEAEAMTVEGAVLMTRLETVGEMNLPGTRIGRMFDLTEAVLDGQVGDGKWGRALFMERAQIGNSAFLTRLTAKGGVSLVGATIGGVLSCTGARIDGKTSDGQWEVALNGERLSVGATLYLNKFQSIGSIALNGAQISGQLFCEKSRMDGRPTESTPSVAFRCERMDVRERFVWRDITIVGGQVNLISAHVGYLDDDIDSWPTQCDQLRLDGFVYQRLADRAVVKTERRLNWLSKIKGEDGAPLPQPYTQLARTLRSMGHDRGAQDVLIERERLMAKQARLDRVIKPNGDWGIALKSGKADLINAIAWVFDVLLRRLAGYGYRAQNSLIAVALLLAVAWMIAAMAWNEGSFVPNSDAVLTSTEWRDIVNQDCLRNPVEHCIANPSHHWSQLKKEGFDWDKFHAGAYAVDLVVPILNLGQTSAWLPSRDRGYWGTTLWWGRWVFTALGLALTALATAAVTKIIQKDRE